MLTTLEKTADGSITLYRPDIDEHYHSVKGALTESCHIFIELGLKRYLSGCSEQDNVIVRIFEVGFGTGLNAALTAAVAKTCQVQIEYFSIELFPLSSDITGKLADLQKVDYANEYKLVNKADWNRPVRINEFFTLHKIEGDLLNADIPQNFNIVYFDAFAPEKQPDMWDESIFKHIFDSMCSGAILTTYCSKGAIRRMWQSIGFIVERLPGPPGGKREVLRATKP